MIFVLICRSHSDFFSMMGEVLKYDFFFFSVCLKRT